MEITVKIPDEIAARAKARGLKVETYIEEILAQQVGASGGSYGVEVTAHYNAASYQLTAQQNRIQILRDRIAQHTQPLFSL
jgi:hypothetical protein